MTQSLHPRGASFAKRTPAAKRGARLVMLLPFALFVGIALLAHFNDRFVFRYADPYTTIALLSVVLLAPFVLYWLQYSPGASAVAEKYPTSWVRKVIVMPFMAALIVGLVFAAPLGWLFAAVAWSDIPVERVSATAVEVGTHARRKNCDQYATLRLAGAEKKTCLDGLYPPSVMRPAQELAVGIKATRFGFLIVSVSDQGVQ